MEPEFVFGLMFFVGVFFGVFGALSRVLVQWKRDGELPYDEDVELYRELALGGVAGLIIWLTNLFPGWRALAVASLTAGFSAVDTIENLLTEKK